MKYVLAVLLLGMSLVARFDIRSFHDELLGAGAIPLDALQARMDAWMARQ